MIYKRPGKSTSWYVDLTNPQTGERVRQSLKFSGSKREAERLAAQLQHEMATSVATSAPEVTCKEATDRYIALLQSQHKPFARELLCTQHKLFSAPDRWHLDANLPLHKLTPVLMEELVVARTREGNKPQTIRHEIGLLRSASKYLAELGVRAPPSNMSWRMPEVGQKTRYLSTEEFQRVYAHLDPTTIATPGTLGDRMRAQRQECRDLLVALAYTGARWSEIATLKWPQVDLERGVIKLWGNKTKQERVVPLSGPLRAVLVRRHESGDRLVFPGPGGVQRAGPSDAIGRAMDAVGLNTPDVVAKHGRATVHSLRHTFASWLVQNGAQLHEVSDALGHSSVAMTQRYAHLSKTATVEKLGGILTKCLPTPTAVLPDVNR